MTSTTIPRTWRRQLLRLLAVATIITPCLLGFGNKFLELVDVYRVDPDGAFAVTPILNYLLASLGFLLLFGWAAANGMFRNIEGPKQSMLENEARLEGQVYCPVPAARRDHRHG